MVSMDSIDIQVGAVAQWLRVGILSERSRVEPHNCHVVPLSKTLYAQQGAIAWSVAMSLGNQGALIDPRVWHIFS